VAFESPRRLPRSLALLADIDPGRRVAVCRELTKRFEEVLRGTATELANRVHEPVKGEVTVVLAAPEPRDVGLGAFVDVVDELVSAGAARRAAVDAVARLGGISRNELYRASLTGRD
jgi:16S rRNA (cytidine1402-2'-O)-methyltransferase